MRLVYTKTKFEVGIGDRVMLRDGDATVTGITRPHKPSSTGRVQVRYDNATWDAEFFPSVIGAEWIEREDQR